MFTKRLENNFLLKFNLATKALRHKGKIRSIFSASCLCDFVAIPVFCSEAAENYFLHVIWQPVQQGGKSLKNFLSAGCRA
jgi:hypothetical protein